MITIILNHHNKYAEVDMPAMYEELQLALWKLGLDRVPEKYTLQDLGATFRYQSPLEYFVLRLLEGEMNLLDAVSAIYTVIAPPRPIMAQVQILSSAFKSIAELRLEVDRMIKSTAQFGSTCFFPVRGWLVGLDGEMEPARDAVMLQNADVIGEAVQRMQSWIIHDMALCFADTETDAEESLFQKILSARWSVGKRGRKLYGRIDLLLTEDLTPEEQEALEEKTRRITTQDMALRLDRWSVLTDKGILYINFGTGREKVFDMDDDIVDDDESNCSEGCLCPECEARLEKYGNISAEDISDVEWLDFLVVGDHTLPRPIDISDLEDTDEYFEKAAELGNADALYGLGKLYLKPEFPDYDPHKAVGYLEQATAKGNAFAKYQLGKLLCQGELVPKDIDRGLPLLEELAENGITFASYIAGKVYLKEEGWQDIKKAIVYLRQAAEDGNSFAEYQLGKIYFLGNGVRVDQEKGLEYLKESAAHGNEYAANLLVTIQQQHTWGVASCTASLIAQLGKVFQEQDQKQSQRQRPRMDRKHRREIEEKKQAMGIRD